MGKFAINNITKIAAWIIAAILIYLNMKLLAGEAVKIFSHDTLWPKLLVILGAVACVSLLIYIIIHPFITQIKKGLSIQMHPDTGIINLDIPVFNKIAIALDFSENDQKLLAYAVGQGREETEYLLIHVVESASAVLLGKESDDYETRRDQQQMDFYVTQLTERGFKADGKLGYRNRVKEIVRLTTENNAAMLVIGAHGHAGIKDFIYGETVNAVRHELRLPVLIVNL